MSFEVPGFKFTRIAAADLRTHQYKFVDITTTGQCNLPTGAGARAIAVNQGKPNTGEAAELMFSGISKVVAGAAIATPGLNVTTDSTGRAVTAATGNLILGIALEAASGAGVVIAVLLYRTGPASP